MRKRWSSLLLFIKNIVFCFREKYKLLYFQFTFILHSWKRREGKKQTFLWTWDIILIHSYHTSLVRQWSSSARMPLMLELKYEYFPNTWPGRIKLLELVSCWQSRFNLRMCIRENADIVPTLNCLFTQEIKIHEIICGLPAGQWTIFAVSSSTHCCSTQILWQNVQHSDQKKISG